LRLHDLKSSNSLGSRLCCALGDTYMRTALSSVAGKPPQFRRGRRPIDIQAQLRGSICCASARGCVSNERSGQACRLVGRRHSRVNVNLFALRAAFSLLVAAGSLFSSTVRAEPPDPLGAIGRHHLPIPTPSTETLPQTFVMNGQKYVIPRNYVVSLGKNDDGTPGSISMRAVLPDFGGLTKETMRCGIGYRDPCSSKVVVIGLTSGPFPTSGSQQLSNAKGISHPEERDGPCGLRYYEGLGSTDKGGVVFRSYFTRFPDEPEISFLSCAKEGSAFAPRCDGHDNVGDGNAFYYTFDRSELCNWRSIRKKSLELIESFKKGKVR